MKKQPMRFEGFGWSSNGDYKLEHQEEEARRNFESCEKWLYLGADASDPKFAKIGMTTGNLASRSYSSANPRYYLFAAFKFRYDISIQDIKRVEDDVRLRIDSMHRDANGLSTRQQHYDSGMLSECFNPVDFFQFYKDMHWIIYEFHRRDFVITGHANEIDEIDGESVYCIFNQHHRDNHRKYTEMIIQYD